MKLEKLRKEPRRSENGDGVAMDTNKHELLLKDEVGLLLNFKHAKLEWQGIVL
jgi:hypothetical protein